MEGLMSIRSKEEQLFNQLQAREKVIVRDGVVNEKAYLASGRKLLFLLKEANSPEAKESWDLRDFVKDTDRAYTWANVARWILGIREIEKNLMWSDVVKRAWSERESLLSSVVVMNVKKTPGRSSSDEADLRSWAVTHRDFLQKQFSLYNPDLVVCCGFGTSRVAQAAEMIHPISKQQTSHGVWTMKVTPETEWITYYHPQARIPAHLMYYGLMDCVREIFPD